MPSFDISSELDMQEVDNAVNLAQKEVANRFDFKGIKSELTLDKKAKTLTLWCSESGKLEALNEIFQGKLVRRGLSLLSLEYGDKEAAFGGSVRQVVKLQAGISKEKAKEITAALKTTKIKVNAQIQDEQVRVTGKSRDDLQEAIAFLRTKQNDIKLPLQFENFRD
jgi:cyclic-di-GMP-binding protein